MMGFTEIAGARIFCLVAVLGAASLCIATASRAADLKTAAANYKEECANCHGENGKGDGPKAAQLNTKPANYTDCDAMKKLDDAYLFKLIKDGGGAVHKSKDMPPFQDVYDDEEIRGLVAYIRSFCAK